MKLRTILQYIFFISLGALFAWLSLRNIGSEEWTKIKTALAEARHWLIIPVFIILILSHYIRSVRWRLLIEPLGYKPSGTNAFFAVLIGYMTNQALPRLGELLKCTVLGRYEKIPVDKLIGTVILERLVDALTLLLVFAITLAIQPQLYSQIMDAITSSSGDTGEKGIPGWVIVGIVIIILILVVALWMKRKKKKLSDIPKLLSDTWRHIAQGVVSIRLLKKRGKFLLLTFALWGCYLLGGYLGFMSFRDTEHYGIKEAFTVLSAGSIGMVVMPGGIGAYAYLIERTMLLYGLNGAIATAFGWILWLAQTTVIVLGGLVSFVAIPYYNKRKNRDPF